MAAMLESAEIKKETFAVPMKFYPEPSTFSLRF
jgi:hypothetical protein